MSTPQPKKRRKWPWIVAGVVAFLIIASLVGDAEEDKDTAAPATTSQAPAESPVEPAPTEEAEPPGPEPPAGVEFRTEGDAVNAEFDIDNSLTEGMVKDGARFETIEILEYARAAYPNASQVTVQGSYPMVDDYGNTSTNVVINLTYLRSTLDRINFDGVDKDKIWELADTAYIQPWFRP